MQSIFCIKVIKKFELSNPGVTQIEKITSLAPLPALAGCKQRSCGGIVIPVVAGSSPVSRPTSHKGFILILN